VYGLPFQTIGSIEGTIELVKKLMPERIAFYSYAHVPWMKGNGQRGFDDNDLPTPEGKRAMYEAGYRLLLEAGYKEVGMDHFALETDEMYISYNAKTLHRNFMGYTASKTQLMVGLGVSSISDSWYAFAQNVKTVEEYYEEIEKNEIPIFKGHLLTEEDLIIRKHILNIMCHFETDWNEEALQHKLVFEAEDRLQEMIQDGLLTIENCTLIVTEKGKPFVRNICMAFDEKLLGIKPGTQLFSMTI
jgi:oxygen-independent coproporphyrinogen-3 oxidase